jgi:hypothetical protein
VVCGSRKEVGDLSYIPRSCIVPTAWLSLPTLAGRCARYHTRVLVLLLSSWRGFRLRKPTVTEPVSQ